MKNMPAWSVAVCTFMYFQDWCIVRLNWYQSIVTLSVLFPSEWILRLKRCTILKYSENNQVPYHEQFYEISSQFHFWKNVKVRDMLFAAKIEISYLFIYLFHLSHRKIDNYHTSNIRVNGKHIWLYNLKENRKYIFVKKWNPFLDKPKFIIIELISIVIHVDLFKLMNCNWYNMERHSFRI